MGEAAARWPHQIGNDALSQGPRECCTGLVGVVANVVVVRVVPSGIIIESRDLDAKAVSNDITVLSKSFLAVTDVFGFNCGRCLGN